MILTGSFVGLFLLVVMESITNKEAAIALDVITGFSFSQAAKKHGISSHSARTATKKCYRQFLNSRVLNKGVGWGFKSEEVRSNFTNPQLNTIRARAYYLVPFINNMAKA